MTRDNEVTPSGHPVGLAVAYAATTLLGVHTALTGPADLAFQVTALLFAAQTAAGLALFYQLSPRQEQP